jgi:hypothetical protein
MTPIQFGWSMSLGDRNVDRATFMDTARKGLDVIAGHFDSVWLPDHLQFEDLDLLEGWTALTYLAGCSQHYTMDTRSSARHFAIPRTSRKWQQPCNT